MAPFKLCPYVRDPQSTAFRNVTVARTDEDFARTFLIQEMTRVANIIRRARNYAIFFGAADVVDQIDQLARTITERTAEQPRGAQ